MEFIVDNIVWFIVGGVVILMTIIGYLAEKTDFASKKYHDKMIARESNKKGKPKEKKNKEKVQENIENNVEIGIVDAVNPVQNDIPENENKETNTVNDLYAPLNNDVLNEANDVPDELFAPLENIENKSETLEENNNIDTISPVDSNSLSGEVNEDLYAPLGDTNVQSNIESASTLATSVEDPNVNTIEELSIEPAEQISNEVVNNFDINTLENTSEASTIEAPVDAIVENNGDVFEQSLEDLKVPDEKNVVEVAQNTSDMPFETLDIQPQIEVQPEETLEELQEVESNVENLQPENIMNVNQTEESLEMPPEGEATIDNEQFDKIFPDDPVIINENHKNTEEVTDTIEPQAVVENQETEDVWKF